MRKNVSEGKERNILMIVYLFLKSNLSIEDYIIQKPEPRNGLFWNFKLYNTKTLVYSTITIDQNYIYFVHKRIEVILDINDKDFLEKIQQHFLGGE